MAFDAHKNFAFGHVAIAPIPADSGTTLTLITGDAAKMPAVPFNVTVYPAGTRPNTSNAEVMRVTNISTDTLTVVRAQEGTGGRIILPGDEFTASITAKTVTDIESVAASAIQPSTAFAGSLVFSTAASQIIPGATSFSIRDAANTRDNVSILDNGSATFVAQPGSGSGVTGAGYVFTTGAGGGGNAQGGDLVINLGQGTGLTRSGMLIINGVATKGTSDNLSQNISAGMLINMVYNLTQTDTGSVQGLEVHLTTTGNGALMTGPSTEPVEFEHFWQATGVSGAIAYGGEATFSQDAVSGTMNVATGWQGNIRGAGLASIASGSSFRATLGPFTGPITTAYAFLAGGLSFSGGGLITTLRGLDVSAMTKVTSAGITLTGGASITGVNATTPIEGGNTSGTNTNRAFRINAGGGSAADGGTALNYGIDLAVPSAAGAGGSTGHTRNFGIQITGNGGTGATGLGGVSNWAIYGSSTASYLFGGSVAIGIGSLTTDSVLTANALQMADAFNMVFGTTTGTKIGTAVSQKLGFWNVTPVVQQVLATGAAHTVDDVITLLQTIGLCKQS